LALTSIVCGSVRAELPSFLPVSRTTLTADKIVIPEAMKSEVRKVEKEKLANI